MKIGATPSFVTLAREPSTRNFSIRLSTDFSQIVSGWTGSTRLSQVFALTDPYSTPLASGFRGKWQLAFLGPLNPYGIVPYIPATACVWLGLGLMNIIVAQQNARGVKKLRAACKELGCAVEIWEVTDGIVRDMKFKPESAEVAVPDMAKLLEITSPPALRAALTEYCPMIAAAMARGRLLPKRIQVGLQRAHATFANDLLSSKVLSGDRAYNVLTQVLSFHSGLSRFVAQTLVGVPPISATESHYWAHSFLGMGTADIALWNICHFLQEKLGELRIPERLSALAETQNSIDYINEITAANLPDYLSEAKIKEPKEESVFQIPFFSSRDGYTSKSTTISAPISAITGCNSMRWSLLTVTHEYIHPIIQEILRDILPNLESEAELASCCRLLQGQTGIAIGDQTKAAVRAGPTVHAETRRLILMSMLMIRDLDHKAPSFDIMKITPSNVVALCEAYEYDVEETLVHLVDFNYIYQRKPEYYIPAIWTSWGTVPNVSSRVAEYVLRTVIAVASKNLRRGMHVALPIARDEIKQALRTLQQSQQGGRYVSKALAVVEDEAQWAGIVDNALACVPLMSLAANILFSEKLSGEIHSESKLGGSTEFGGYKLKYLEMDGSVIDNPLLFISNFTAHEEPSAAKSAWLLSMLAYGVTGA